MADDSMMWCVGLLVVFLLFGGCCWCMCQRDESAPRAVGLRQRGARRAPRRAKLAAEPEEPEEPETKPEGYCYAKRPVLPNCSKATMNGRMNLKGAQYAHIAGGAALRNQIEESSADLDGARQTMMAARAGVEGARKNADENAMMAMVLQGQAGAEELRNALAFAGGNSGSGHVAMDRAVAYAAEKEE